MPLHGCNTVEFGGSCNNISSSINAMTCIIRTAFTSVLINDGKIIITQHRVKNRTGNDRLAGFLQWMGFRLSQAESTDRKSVWELYRLYESRYVR